MLWGLHFGRSCLGFSLMCCNDRHLNVVLVVLCNVIAKALDARKML